MKIFYDLEFLERGPELPIRPVSIGLVRDDGEELYLINRDMPLSLVANSPFLQLNVLPHLPIKMNFGAGAIVEWDGEHDDIHLVHPIDVIADRVKEFILEGYDVEEYGKPQLWAYYGAYDHVVLCQLFGTMVDLPPGIPMFTNDLMQEWGRLGQPPILPSQANEHRAVDDARWNAEAFAELEDWRRFEDKHGKAGSEPDIINAYRIWQNR